MAHRTAVRPAAFATVTTALRPARRPQNGRRRTAGLHRYV